MRDYDYTTESDQVCLACSVLGCACDEFITGCESEQDLIQAHVEKTYAIYREALDRMPRVYDDILARARKAYIDAVTTL